MNAHVLSVVVALVCAAQATSAPRGSRQLPLNGAWRFTIDPQGRGEAQRWQDATPELRWDRVTVPHCWNADPRFPYTGVAWYRRNFQTPAGWSGLRARLRFGAVFYKAHVWVNGKSAGTHEGGYTPFEFDVTELLNPAAGENLVVVQVDNRWDDTTLPGSRPGSTPELEVYPWWEYGGLIRDVTLQAVPALSIATMKVESEPDLTRGTARVRVAVQLRNAGPEPATVNVSAEPSRDGASLSATYRRSQKLEIPAHDGATARLEFDLAAADVALWHPDTPRLYRMKVSAGDDELESSFGIRKIETRGTQLLLNGEPLKMAGANRPVDDPTYGSLEPAEVVERDLRLMKEAGLELMRIIHYAPDERVVEWADRHGMLLILEAGNWQLSPEQMDSPLMRARWRTQMGELVERDWNHPSVIAWSVGNEFASNTRSGIEWVRDGRDFVRSLDSSRLVTFASNRAAAASNRRPTDEASGLVDLVMINTYSSGAELARTFDHVHELWPDKPLLVSEYGARADAVNVYGEPMDGDASALSEQYFNDFLATVRARPWISGTSVWTFNDYRSRFPGTHADGYRWWGLVDAKRVKRPSYVWMRREMAPAVIGDLRSSANGVSVQLSSRSDFPAYTLRGYRLRWTWLDGQNRELSREEQALPVLAPGSAHTSAARPPSGAASVRLEVLRPTGFVMCDRNQVVPKQVAH